MSIMQKEQTDYPLVIYHKWQNGDALWLKVSDYKGNSFRYKNLYLDYATLFFYGVGQEATFESLKANHVGESLAIPIESIQRELFAYIRLSLLLKKLIPETKFF